MIVGLLNNQFIPIARHEKNSEKKAEIYTAANTMTTTLLGENPVFYNGFISCNHCVLAKIFAQKRDSEKTMEHLRLALKHAKQFEFRPEKSRYAPCWLGLIEDIKSDSTKTDENTLFEDILETLKNDAFDFMRDTADFKNYLNEINCLSDKLKSLK